MSKCNAVIASKQPFRLSSQAPQASCRCRVRESKIRLPQLYETEARGRLHHGAPCAPERRANNDDFAT